MRRLLWLIVPPLLLAACDPAEKEDPGKPGTDPITPNTEYTTVKVGRPADITGYWADGDIVNVNGTSSAALEGVGSESSNAFFIFPAALTTPYRLLYPASFYSDATHIDIPAAQTYTTGKIASGTAPMAGYSNNPENGGSLNHLCAFIRIPVRKDANVSASRLSTLKFKGNNGEQLCGIFRIDYENHAMESAGEGGQLTLNVGQALSESSALDLYLAVPARTYSKGFSVELEDEEHRIMKAARSDGIALEAGKLTSLNSFSFKPSDKVYELTLEGEDPVVTPPDVYNVSGRVVDNKGKGIEGVVVSDGTLCVQTLSDGTFYINSDIADVKYVFVSTPSGYLPPVEAGMPRFYKEKSGASVSGGKYDFGDFVLTPVANPGTFTLLITADPQPRKSTATLDNVAYRSWKCVLSMFRDLKETAAAINGRQVYGICLGDLVHGNDATNLALMDDYASELGNLGYPTYNIIGNHDNDLTAADDDGAAWKFESLFGPRNYSFNIGGIHFVMLDNLIQGGNDNTLAIDKYEQGLTDKVWTWLQNDMSFIPTGTTIMVCAHSPMFRQETGSERSNTARHGPDYGALFDKYAEVHAWAGHTHSTFNYVYPSSHRHRNVEVHTLARSTGELWTNEYLANGTPRGFTVVDIVNGKVSSWQFHATKYLMSNHHGNYGAPDYTYCDWEYVSFESIKIARMKDTKQYLDPNYQMHVYAPGAYGDNYIYVNVFLWDDKWQNPVYIPEGGSPVTMTHLEAYDGSTPVATTYDRGDAEFRTFYYNNSNYRKTLGSDYTATNPGLHTLFRAPAAASGKGTVSVTDRFGNTYTRTVSW
ncbi:MAG: calcineurin-like phosphoesterase C-terminal domain-containing protein [Bacteroidales bacterium]|nr:calcineurin-like phosphoesterase C-terminal domain-containing protein [Bacteroidales bacterium]